RLGGAARVVEAEPLVLVGLDRAEARVLPVVREGDLGSGGSRGQPEIRQGVEDPEVSAHHLVPALDDHARQVARRLGGAEVTLLDDGPDGLAAELRYD